MSSHLGALSSEFSGPATRMGTRVWALLRGRAGKGVGEW